MIVLTAIVIAAIPTLIYSLLIWWLDRYEKEPFALVLAAFCWGALPAIVLALLFEDMLGPPGSRTTSVWLVPLVEECIKALALVGLFLWARSEFDGPLDGIVYGALVGFGFAMTENALYFALHHSQIGDLFWTRAVLFGANHALFSSAIGLALGAIRYHTSRLLKLAALGGGLALAVLFHALHNSLAYDAQVLGFFFSWLVECSGVLVIIAVAVLAWRHERGWIECELGDEIGAGVISAADYAVVVSPAQRLRSQARALLHGGWSHYWQVRRLHHLITELAFCKSKTKLSDRFQSHTQHDRLRAEIHALRKALAQRL